MSSPSASKPVIAIDALSVGGFKSISDEQSIEVRPPIILAGNNSSGKSRVLAQGPDRGVAPMKLDWSKGAFRAIALLSGVMLVLTGLVVLIFASPGRRQVALTLQSVYSPDRRVCYNVDVSGELSSVPVIDSERHTVRGVFLRLVRHGLGYQSQRVVFSRSFDAEYQVVTSAVAPTWRSKYVPGPDFVLPSGRIVPAADGAILFVLFDGQDCELLRLDAEGREARAVAVEPAYQDALADLYRTSFSVDDVYWCYGLVNNADFFGFKSEGVDFANFVDTERLYGLWSRSLGDGR